LLGGWRNFMLHGRALYFLQTESFDLGQITMKEVKANAGKIMIDNINGA